MAKQANQLLAMPSYYQFSLSKQSPPITLICAESRNQEDGYASI